MHTAANAVENWGKGKTKPKIDIHDKMGNSFSMENDWIAYMCS